MSMAFTSLFTPCIQRIHTQPKKKGKRGPYHGLHTGSGRKVNQSAMAMIGCQNIK